MPAIQSNRALSEVGHNKSLGQVDDERCIHHGNDSDLERRKQLETENKVLRHKLQEARKRIRILHMTNHLSTASFKKSRGGGVCKNLRLPRLHSLFPHRRRRHVVDKYADDRNKPTAATQIMMDAQSVVAVCDPYEDIVSEYLQLEFTSLPVEIPTEDMTQLPPPSLAHHVPPSLLPPRDTHCDMTDLRSLAEF